MTELLSSPFFGISLSLGAYLAGSWLCQRFRLTLVNPMLLAALLVIGFLKVTHIPMEYYNIGGDFIAMFLAPATVVLAFSIYNQFEMLKKNLLPVLAGCIVGAVTSMVSVFGLCKLFGLDKEMTISLLPKSVTTPIAMSVSQQLGGVLPITVAAVIVTGILGSILIPVLLRFVKVGSPLAVGLGIGASSHAVGTVKALEMGELEGAMSSLAIGITGFVTVLLAMFL